MTKEWVATVKVLLQEVIGQQIRTKVKTQLFKHFGDVWIQDSTTVHLPDILAKLYKGNVSGGKQKSVAKLNVIVHAVSGRCPIMEWSGFTVNEQSLAKNILQIAKAGDLVIRDLGYFTLSVFEQLTERGIYFLSRWKFGTKLYDKDGTEINLTRLLRGRTWIDRQVICGKDNPVKVRLVAIKLSSAHANERRRKARKDRDQRLNHNKAYYELLGYVIFITTVDAEKWNYRQVAQAYRLRWNIEILFKSWKTGFKMEQLIPEARTNTERIESILYLMLIYIAWFQMLIYVPLRWSINEQTGKNLSIIKTAMLIRSQSINRIKTGLTAALKNKIIYYCCYEKRSDRLNEDALLQHFLIPLA